LRREWLADSSAVGESVIDFVIRSHRVPGMRAQRGVIIWAGRKIEAAYSRYTPRCFGISDSNAITAQIATSAITQER
jgi:hypothetical protein